MASNATSTAGSAIPGAPAAVPDVDPLEKATMRLVACRLIPLLMAGYFAAFLDRVDRSDGKDDFRLKAAPRATP